MHHRSFKIARAEMPLYQYLRQGVHICSLYRPSAEAQRLGGCTVIHARAIPMYQPELGAVSYCARGVHLQPDLAPQQRNSVRGGCTVHLSRAVTLMLLVFSRSSRKAAMRRLRSAFLASRSFFSFSFMKSSNSDSLSALGAACTPAAAAEHLSLWACFQTIVKHLGQAQARGKCSYLTIMRHIRLAQTRACQ